jgi:hypothetical protein
MRLFDHFPQKDKVHCPLCGTADDRPCFPLPIDGTEQDDVCESTLVHADCIREQLDSFRYNRDEGIVYIRPVKD